MEGWADREWRTLQFGPIWVVSAIIGRTRFDELERKAFADSVVAAPLGVTPLPWQLMQAIDRDADALSGEFAQDDRSIASGLSQVTTLLERVDGETSRRTREAMLRVGAGVARARGPFGRRMSEQDAQQLALVARLMETALETAYDISLDVDGLDLMPS
jgi:hypothetical protein